MKLIDVTGIIPKLQREPFFRERLFLFGLQKIGSSEYLIEHELDISALCLESPTNRIRVDSKTIISIQNVLGKKGDHFCLVHSHPLNSDLSAVFFSPDDYSFMRHVCDLSPKTAYAGILVFGVYDTFSIDFCYYHQGGFKKCLIN